jgi:hypothetical protein
MFLFIDPPLRPSKEGNFRYSIFFNLLAIIVYRQTLNSIEKKGRIKRKYFFGSTGNLVKSLQLA